MAMDYAVSMNGYQAAVNCLEKVAGRVALSSSRAVEGDADAITCFDPAAEMVLLTQVEATAEANLRALSAQDELNRDALDILG